MLMQQRGPLLRYIPVETSNWESGNVPIGEKKVNSPLRVHLELTSDIIQMS